MNKYCITNATIMIFAMPWCYILYSGEHYACGITLNLDRYIHTGKAKKQENQTYDL